MGATSYVKGRRFKRPASLQGYADWVSKGGPEEGLEEDADDNDGDDDDEEGEGIGKLAEALMVGMRMSDGVDLG